MEQSELYRHRYDRRICRTDTEKPSAGKEKMDLPVRRRKRNGHRWLAMASPTSRHQKDMDQFHGSGQQWLLLPAYGSILLPDRLQRFPAGLDLAKSDWNELHTGIYAQRRSRGHSTRLYQPLPVLWLQTIPATGAIPAPHPNVQPGFGLLPALYPVQTPDFHQGITLKEFIKFIKFIRFLVLSEQNHINIPLPPSVSDQYR